MASSAVASSSSPTNIMLAVYEKKTVAVELYRPLRQFIALNYSEREAQSLEDDLQSVKRMRSDLERPPDSVAARRDLLHSYYKALCVMESRFPISPDEGHINSITFQWHDAFKPKQKASQQSIQLEKAAVLFNIGAVHSQIGLTHDRTSVEGRRQASHAFISAAGAFSFLKDNHAMKSHVSGTTTIDLLVESAAMLEKLMLAQAQECFFENSIAKGSTASVSSKISRQVSLYYEEVQASLNTQPLNQHFNKGWTTHVQLKVSLFFAEACYRYSLNLHEKEEIAEEITRLRTATNALSEAKKSSRGGGAAQLNDSIAKLEAKLNQNLDRAVKENDRVYLMRIPLALSLPPLPSVSLVKPLPMSENLDASREKLFAALVPDSSAKSLSRYTEMVDEVIRTNAEKLQQGSELARVKLKEMDLPDSILALEGNRTFPLHVKEEAEAIQISGGPSGLEAELQQLKDLRRVNQEMLMTTEQLLQNEAREDAQFRTQFGPRWTRPQSLTLTKNLLDRLSRFASNLKQAADSDARIERSLHDGYQLMSILDQHPIDSALPVLSKPMMSLNADEDTIVGNLKQSLRQLEGLGAHRAGLEDMLKEMKRKDDVLPKLMSSVGISSDELFRKEIAKYDGVCGEIAANLEDQERLLLQIRSQNDAFSAVFNLEDYGAARERACKQVQAASAKYREVRENMNEGMKFYVTLQEAIVTVKQQCSDFVMTRNMQCQDMMDDVQRQMSGLSFRSPVAPPGYIPPSPHQQQPLGYYGPVHPPHQQAQPFPSAYYNVPPHQHPRGFGRPATVPSPYPPHHSGYYDPPQ